MSWLTWDSAYDSACSWADSWASAYDRELTLFWLHNFSTVYCLVPVCCAVCYSGLRCSAYTTLANALFMPLCFALAFILIFWRFIHKRSAYRSFLFTKVTIYVALYAIYVDILDNISSLLHDIQMCICCCVAPSNSRYCRVQYRNSLKGEIKYLIFRVEILLQVWHMQIK